MTDDLELSALGAAAAAAIGYRKTVLAAERTPTADYAQMLAAFAGPTPERGGDGAAIIEELVRLATPGIRAACPSEPGRTFVSRSLTSVDSPVTAP